MTLLNKNTKKASGFINAYIRSDKTSIFRAYRNPSEAKIAIYDKIREKAIATNAVTPVYIISAGCQFFSTAYETIYEGRQGLVVDTYCNTYFIPW